LRGELDSLQRSIDAWDAAVARFEGDARSAPPSADLHAALGSAYLDRLRTADALREFAAAAKIDPRRADVHELSAAAYAFEGDERSAVAARNRARTIDAATPTPRAGLLQQVAGVAPIFPPEIYVPGFRLLERGQLAAGVAKLRAALPYDAAASTSAASAAVAAGTRLRHGQLQAAFAELRQAPAPADAETFRVMGVAYWADADYERSIDALRSAVERSSRDERARVALADVLVTSGRRPEAKRVLSDALASLPDSGQSHYRLGRIYEAESSIEDALAEYEKAALCAPLTGLDGLFALIGSLAAAQADFGHAVSAYRRRIDANPGNGEAHRKLAEIYAVQGDAATALAEFAVATSVNARDAEAYAGAAQSYLRLNRFADAAQSARSALAIDPSQQKARFALGTALTRLGDATAGQHELDEFQREVDDTAALRRHALELDALINQAARARAVGNDAEAARLLSAAIDAGAHDAVVEAQLATALLHSSKPDDALTHVETALGGNPNDPALHQLASEILGALGRQAEREREEQLSWLLLAQRKEQLLTQHPLLR
jgi:tetratricopeptide (TPR) repeat protein